MTEREKISHVLRRLGLGAGRYERTQYERLGLQGTIERLIGFDRVDEKFPYSPWSFAVQQDRKLYTDPYQIAGWWGLRFLMTRRPLQEKLTLFWHDHFAVSGEKVFEGPTMLEYTDILRRHGKGKFRDLLRAVTKHAALVSYLDNNTSTKLHPNENLAREMFELFTLGVGNYSEADVKESARALTGWAVHYSGLGDDTPFPEQAERAARQGMSVFNFCVVPAQHDGGTKSILGKKGNLDGDDLLDMLAAMPETASLICRKLWEFFAYKDPEPEVMTALTGTWQATDGDIASVLRTMVGRPEFYSFKAVRTMPKSPLDFTVALFRCLGVSDIFLTLGGIPSDPYEPVKEDLRKIGSGVFYLMSQQGLTLLFPPNVGGWDWGTAWITSNNTVVRVNHAQLLFVGDDPNRFVAVMLGQKLKSEDHVANSGAVIDALADIFDAELTPTDRTLLAQACDRAGGVGAFGDKESASKMLAEVGKLLFAMPGFQLC